MLSRLGLWMIVAALAVVAGRFVGLGVRHMIFGPTAGPGIMLAALGGLAAWSAYRLYAGDPDGGGR